MILRKPYAILIKHFKLIHAILAVLMGYLVYRTNLIITFIKDYIGSSQLKVSSEKVASLFGPTLYVLIALTVILTAVIMYLLIFKKKPIKFYIYNIIAHIYTLVIYIVAYALISELQHGLVEIKTLKMIGDLCTASFILQIVALVIVVIRATGFDIKGFNFKEDLAELEIDEKDNEEFEVNLNIDTDKLKRQTRKKLRYTKYVYLENKFIINIVAILIVIISVTLYIVNTDVYSKTYKKYDTFKTNEFMFSIGESFITKYDYRGNLIKEGKELVVIRFAARKLYGKTGKINTGRFILNTNDTNYYHTTIYNDELSDIGTTYINEKISLTNLEYYLLVFEVDEVNVNNKMKLSYTDTKRYISAADDVVDITIVPENLNEKEESVNKKIGEELNFNGSIIGNSTFKIDSYELNDQFKLDYRYCIKENCYDAVQYVTTSAKNNYKKTLLKIIGEFNLDKDFPGTINLNIYKMMHKFATLKYDNNKQFINFVQIKPKKSNYPNTYFIEVPEDLKNATNITLELNVRNKVYNYSLK